MNCRGDSCVSVTVVTGALNLGRPRLDGLPPEGRKAGWATLPFRRRKKY